jgi:hypothetical protein
MGVGMKKYVRGGVSQIGMEGEEGEGRRKRRSF